MLTVLGGGTPSEEPYKIERSLRFNSPDTAYLSRTPIAAGNRKTWTWSGWVKRSNLDSIQNIFSVYTGVNSNLGLFTFGFNASNKIAIDGYSLNWRVTTSVYRDVSAWYHIVVAFDSSQSVANDRIKLFINGLQITAFDTINNPTQNTDYPVNSSNIHYLGRSSFSAANYINSYLTEVHFIDGLALGPEEFGEIDPNTNVWRPKQYEAEAPPLSVQYLVVAGGGGGGTRNGAGGGAGGYRNSYAAESSGGGGSTETPLNLSTGTAYTVTVGAGASAVTSTPDVRGNSGNNSIFASITSTGGGGGGANAVDSGNGATGGSGGGAGFSEGSDTGGSGTANQGYAGGNSGASAPNRGGGGGGGAGAVGSVGSGSGGAGGNGLASLITGSSVTRGGGGGGAGESSGASGGSGGGGAGSKSGTPGSGTVNTGGGGGGKWDSGTVGAGGSGIVILRFPSTYNITVGAGLTYSQSTVDSDKVVQFTAGTGTVSFS